ncbi:uncharacterized protein BO87DRAFT_418136 [Aspergillus neoniger CBS 115656]|uniref:Uncharacterized protein n=1 Tax=Aspergillus neoniger (strain CBS 115656) TaxID=1448310 RepID=A0A318YAG3_ASPNB|nr:hypothetical protein BO87DRAFT_418136 [Aspergillus neoniger CBS 115656]PYH31335.1 hypothetical protein BO87DRAFT_418136 [Aspergillus neoniger CBS 115656]
MSVVLVFVTELEWEGNGTKRRIDEDELRYLRGEGWGVLGGGRLNRGQYYLIVRYATTLTSDGRVCPLDAAPASNYLGMDEVIREIGPAPAESRGNSTAWHHQPFRNTGQRAVVVALAIPVQSLVFIPTHVLDVKGTRRIPPPRADQSTTRSARIKEYLGIADTSVSAGLGIARKLAVLRLQEVRQSSGERKDVHGMDVVMYNPG